MPVAPSVLPAPEITFKLRKEINVKTYIIKSETGDKLRAAAPMLGLKPAPRRVALDGTETLELPEFVALKFDSMRKAAKVSADVLIGRVLKNLAA